MSDKNLNTVQKILSTFQRLDSLNEKQLAAFRATITKATAASKEAGDEQMVTLLEKIEAKLPERKAPPAKKAQTISDLTSEYDGEYQKKSAAQQTAFRALLTRRLNQAEAEGLVDDFNQLLALQARMERESEEIRRKYILGLAAKLIE
jgi:hypothetical protein